MSSDSWGVICALVVKDFRRTLSPAETELFNECLMRIYRDPRVDRIHKFVFRERPPLVDFMYRDDNFVLFYYWTQRNVHFVQPPDFLCKASLSHSSCIARKKAHSLMFTIKRSSLPQFRCAKEAVAQDTVVVIQIMIEKEKLGKSLSHYSSSPSSLSPRPIRYLIS